MNLTDPSPGRCASTLSPRERGIIWGSAPLFNRQSPIANYSIATGGAGSGVRNGFAARGRNHADVTFLVKHGGEYDTNTHPVLKGLHQSGRGECTSMATKANIIAGIEFRVGSSGSYTSWKIGLTNNAEERRRQLKFSDDPNTDRWAEWDANSLGEAEDIKSRFVEKGMTGVEDGNVLRFKTVYVFIF